MPGRCIVMDRAGTLPTPPEQVWPWLVQLGKGRAGWYFPASVEHAIPTERRGLHNLEPGYQRLAVGDRIGDWGPGDPEFRAELVDPPRALVWSSLRQRSHGHRWPEGDLDPWTPDLPDDVLALSWALVLRPVAPDNARLQLRLRARSRSRLKPLWETAGGAFDWLTVRLLLAGLRERLVAQASATDRTV